MNHQNRTKRDLLEEISALNRQIRELDSPNAGKASAALEAETNGKEIHHEKHFPDSMVNLLPGLFWILDEEGKFLRWNSSLGQLVGYPASELAGRNLLDIIREDCKAAAAQKMREVHSAGKADLETVLLSSTGREVPCYFYGQRIVLDGRPHMVGTGIDLSRRKEAEDGLRESEKKYRQLFMNAPAAICEIDYESNRFISFNEIAFTLSGYSREELPRMRPWDLFTKESKRAYLGRLRSLKEGRDVSASQEYQLRKKDGTILWVNMNMDYEREEGRTVKARIVAHDITDSKAMEEALRQSEERYRTIIEQMEDGYFEMDLAGRFIFMNDAECRKLGYRREELLGLNTLRYIDDARADEIIRLYKGVFKTGMPVATYDVEITRKDGARVVHEISASLIRDAAGNPAGFRGIARDITDRKRAEEERYHYEKLHGVLEIAATVCHELNQPMQIISGFSELMLRDASENDPIRGKLEKINRQVQRMSNITKKLMEIRDYETQDYAGFSRIININEQAAKDNE